MYVWRDSRNVFHSFVHPEVCVQICGIEARVDVIGKNAKEGSKCNSSACADQNSLLSK